MRFSVLTITLNSQRYLDEALRSVANQNFSNYEHILWDGGSTDATLDIAAKFPHVKVFQGKDEGIADAMNKAASLATGEFLLFLHSDDSLAGEDMLLSVDTCLKQHPDVSWLYGRVNVVDAEGNEIKTTPFERFSQKRLRRYNFISHPATFVSRSLFRQVGGFQTKLCYCMDYDLWLRLAKVSTPFIFPSVISKFREHADSLSTTRPISVAGEAHFVRKQYVSRIWGRWRSYRTWKRRIRKFS